jgi:hypothetical protein
MEVTLGVVPVYFRVLLIDMNSSSSFFHLQLIVRRFFLMMMVIMMFVMFVMLLAVFLGIKVRFMGFDERHS